ncbi:hypothetical protein A9G39_04120 [Gilliamella sp. Imp1-6]|nr:hypothetical protein A9G31_06010 [Gilliamella apicola]OCG67870.1 hypothetical protein A9G39_04120 [Gilliamella apicola]
MRNNYQCQHRQTYVSNLFKHLNLQSFTQIQISSKKSAKLFVSTPRLKFISKFPISLSLTPLLLLPYSFSLQALSASTINNVHGSAPYLTFDGGQTKVTDTDTLLGIELPDGRVITPLTNTSSSANPIIVSDGGTLNDIHMVVPSGENTVSLSDLVSLGNWGDDDGDGQGAGGVAASGSISLAIKDKDGTTVSRGDTLSKCSAPYKVTLSSTGGSLTTQYGLPNRSTFSGGSVEYYIKPDSSGSCYFVQSVRPNLLVGGTSDIVSFDNPRYAGPSNIWNPDKGFLVQSTSPSSYDRNFPTTGADGLYFDLEIPTEIDASQLSWTVNTIGSLGVTVSWVTPLTGTFRDPRRDTVPADLWITDKSKNVTRVTLHGPEARSQWSNPDPFQITVPSLPQTFELVGSDGSGHEVRYGFVLRQWFVHRGGREVNLFNQAAWCNSLGYRMSRVSDLTNAVKTDNPPISGAAPSSSGNYYQRHIGAGFFTEWGDMNLYVDAGFVRNPYWASDATGSGDGLIIYSNLGPVNIRSVSDNGSAVCTAP